MKFNIDIGVIGKLYQMLIIISCYKLLDSVKMHGSDRSPSDQNSWQFRNIASNAVSAGKNPKRLMPMSEV